MSSPLIGIVTSRIHRRGNTAMYLNEAYVQAVLRGGGAPVLIPLGLPEETLRGILPRLDGVVFSGGGDMHPKTYHSHMHPKVSDVDRDRDRVELSLFPEILQSNKPFLGICRGFQVLNVALGGTLYEDILDQHTGAMRHSYYPEFPRDYPAHPVQVSEESRLARILGKPLLEVNSLHHQGIRDLAPGLKPTAYAPDGIVEGVELPGHPFCLAVQWHPEAMPDVAEMRQIFQAFVQAAREKQLA